MNTIECAIELKQYKSNCSKLNQYLDHTGVVKEGKQWLAERWGAGLIVHHSNLDPLWVSSNAQTDQRDLDDRQQKLETQWAANTWDTVRQSQTLPGNRFLMLGTILSTYPGILFIRTIVLIIRAAMFLHFGSMCLARTFQSAEHKMKAR